MLVKFIVVLVAAMAALAVTPTVATGKGGKPAVVAPNDVVEGDAYGVRVKVPRSGAATKVELQRRGEDIWGGTTWTKVRAWKVRNGKGTRTVSLTADEEASSTLRAIVRYRDRKKPVASSSSTVRYWHWYALDRFQAYARVGYVADHGYLSYGMNGALWKGWNSSGGGESRYTLGRNCSRFKGHVGLGDDSADTASGVISFELIDSANSTTSIYTSPTLTPGMAVPVDLALDLPYRFGIKGTSTTAAGPDGRPPRTTLVVGGASFLCHFAE